MKKTIAILSAVVCAGYMSASAELLVAFDEVTGNPDNGNTQTANYTETGFTATYETDSNNFGATTTGGLAGHTFGSYDSSTATGTGEYDNGVEDHLSLNNGLEGGVVFAITNTSGQAWNLNTFHFDHGATRPGAADNWELTVNSGGLTVGSVATGGPVNNGASAAAAWNDIDISLTGLADYTLENGASVEFLLNFTKDSTQGPSGHHAYFDNFAITGTVIPEPGTLGLVAAFGGGVLFIRRRFMI